MHYEHIKMQIHAWDCCKSRATLCRSSQKQVVCPFSSHCKVVVIRGVFHQKAGSVIIPIGVLKNHPVTLYNVMQSREKDRERERGLSEWKALIVLFPPLWATAATPKVNS